MYKNENLNIAIKIDKENKKLFSYYFCKDKIEKSTEGVLKELNSELNEQVSNHFNIDTANYGVTVKNEPNIKMSI